MLNLIIAIFYQPFLNALVLIYGWLDRFMDQPDMGIAVILFTVLIRIALLPLTIASTESETERRRLGQAYEDLRQKYESSEPLKFKQLKNQMIREHRGTVVFEGINLFVQLAIAIILWRVFSQGLEGADLHLLYKWVPDVSLPFNLTFMGEIDLTKPSLTMNILSSALLFLVETLNLTFSPLPPSKAERLAQFLLPLIVFIYLYNMPAGKKFFVVTTLIISVLIIFIREASHMFALLREKRK